MPKRFQVLVVGVGSIGERHARCFQQTDRADVSICEINESLRIQIAERYDIQHSFSDLSVAIAAAPHAAVICTPAHLHIPMAIPLAEAGIHLLIEKPLSTSLDGVERLKSIIADGNLTAAVAYVQRANPVLIDLKQALDAERFGKPVELVVTAGQSFSYFRPAYRDTYYTNHATGGGAIQDALTHMINAAEWLMGPVTQLAADAAHQVLQGVEVEDTVHVIGRHGSVLASYALNQYQAPNEVSLTIVCEKGTLRAELHRCRWRWMADPQDDWHDEPVSAVKRDALFLRQAHSFLDTLEGKSPAVCTLDEGIQTLRVNLAILKAVETRAWQDLTT